MEYTLSNQLSWAWSMTKNHRSALLTYFILEFIAILLSLLFVFWSKQAIDLALLPETGNMRTVLVLVVLSVALALVIHGFSGWLNEKTRLKMGLELQKHMIETQMMSIWKMVKNWHSGDIQSRIHTDCTEVVNMVAYSSISFLLTTIKLLASFTFLWSMDPMLATIVLSITPIFLFSKVYFKKMRRLSKEVKQEESGFWGILQENLRFRMLIRSMDLMMARTAKLDLSQSMIYRLKSEQLTFSTLSQFAMKCTINIGYLITFIWGVQRLHAGQISFGTMAAFLQLVGRIQTPVLVLSGFFNLFIRFRTSADRLIEMDGAQKENVIIAQPLQSITLLEIQNLHFSYEDLVVIDQLSIQAKPDAPTAIIGSSGKGKTTLMRLLLKMLDPQSGEIWLTDEYGRHQLSASHRINFAYVPQGNSLFSGTVRENITIGSSTADQKRIDHAIWLACAEFVYQLPDGLDTIVGESGHGLSEGQAQRIAIARAMIRDCGIWLFDEITSCLDQQTSTLLIARLLQQGKNKICIFVTHDPLLANACSETVHIN